MAASPLKLYWGGGICSNIPWFFAMLCLRSVITTAGWIVILSNSSIQQIPLSLNTSVPLHTLDQEEAVFQADSDFSLLSFTFVQGYDDLCLQYIANDIDCRYIGYIALLSNKWAWHEFSAWLSLKQVSDLNAQGFLHACTLVLITGTIIWVGCVSTSSFLLS